MIVAFRTEGHSKIGTGHVYECLNIAKALKQEGISSLFIINDNKKIFDMVNGAVKFVEVIHNSELNEDVKKTKQLIRKYRVSCVIINMRRVNSRYVSDLKGEGIKTVVIDELGKKKINCDVLINGSIVDKWHKYKTGIKTKTYFGTAYKILNTDFERYHLVKKVIKNKITKILVIMGGGDKTGTTFKIIDALKPLDKNIIKIIAIGPGFKFMKKIKKFRKKLKNQGYIIKKNIPNVAEIMYTSDLVFSCGGNTAYELACVGTPGIVLYEEKHEKEQSDLLEKMGVLLNLGKGTKVKNAEIEKTISHLDINSKKRLKMSDCGKRIIDGKGTSRAVGIIKSLTRR